MRGRLRIAPSFRGLSAASEASSYAKKMNRSSGTTHEHLLRTHLWRLGLRYRKNVGTLPGKPDIVFARERVAIFCDGDFWHGRDWRRLSRKLRAGTNASYWIPKIGTNRNRDRRNDRLLKREGWTVIRLWETDIHRDPEQAAHRIADLVHKNSRGCDAIH